MKKPKLKIHQYLGGGGITLEQNSTFFASSDLPLLQSVC